MKDTGNICTTETLVYIINNNNNNKEH